MEGIKKKRRMKKLLIFLFSIVSFAALGQAGAIQQSGIFLRVNDTTAYQTAAAAKHSAGYYDIYFNNQATTPHFDIWNGSGYTHVFDFNTGTAGGGGWTLNGTTNLTGPVSITSTNPLSFVTTDDIVLQSSDSISLNFNTLLLSGLQNDDTKDSVLVMSGDGVLYWRDAATLGGGGLTPPIDATDIADGSVTDTEFQYLDGVTSDIQPQIDGKQDEFTSQTAATVYAAPGSSSGVPAFLSLTPEHLATLNASRTVTSGSASVQSDNLHKVYLNSAGSNNMVIDLLAVGTEITFINIGAGTWTLTQGSGVTLPGGSVTVESGANAVVIYRVAATPDVYTGVSGALTEDDLTDSRTMTSADDLDQTDNLNIVYADSGTPFNITVDLLAAKTQVTVINKNTATVTLIEGSGVTLVGTTIDIEEGESATIIYEDPANPDVYLSTVTTGGGGSGDLTIGVSTITSGTNGNFLYNNSGLVGERTPGSGVATWFSTPSYANLGSALTGTSLWPLLASGGTLTGSYTITSNTANQDLRTGTFTTTANNQFFGRQAGTYTLRNTTTDEFYTRLHAETLVAGANSQKLVSLKLNPTFTNGAFTSVSNVALLAETGSVFIGTGIMNSTTKFSVRGLGDTSGTITATFKNGTGNDLFTIYGDGGLVIRDGNALNFRGTSGNEYISSPASGQLTFFTAAAAVTTGAYRFRWGGSSSTSGVIPTISVGSAGSVNPSSGTATFPSVLVETPYNVTGGTANGISFYSAPVVTLLPKMTGFKHEPTNPSNITTNIAFESVTGSNFLGSAGGTITASTRVDQRGLGTTSSTINHRWANSSNTVLMQLDDAGSVTLSGNIVGRAVLVGGTVTVNTTAIQSADEIFLTNRITGGTPGLLSVGTVTAGTSFVINSASGSDTSTISWMIIKH
jgi:hypothetical protein